MATPLQFKPRDNETKYDNHLNDRQTEKTAEIINNTHTLCNRRFRRSSILKEIRGNYSPIRYPCRAFDFITSDLNGNLP